MRSLVIDYIKWACGAEVQVHGHHIVNIFCPAFCIFILFCLYLVCVT
jgi:hypothetical protein